MWLVSNDCYFCLGFICLNCVKSNKRFKFMDGTRTRLISRTQFVIRTKITFC